MPRSGDAKWKSFTGDVPGGKWLLTVSSVDVMKRVEGKESTATVISGYWSGAVGPSASLWRRAAWACMNNIVLLDGLGVVTRPGMHTGHFGVLGGCCGSSVRPGGSEMSTSSTLDRKRGLILCV